MREDIMNRLTAGMGVGRDALKIAVTCIVP